MKQRNRRKILAAKSYASILRKQAGIEGLKSLHGFLDTVERFINILIEKVDKAVAEKKSKELQDYGS